MSASKTTLYGMHMKKFLNVGGNSKSIAVPPQYAGWEHVLLDIDPHSGADVISDARELTKLPHASYDSVYCSHNLEHYYHHDVPKVLAGFKHILKPDGFVLITVPDIHALMKTVIESNLDIEDVLGQSKAGPITVRDVLYGYSDEIEKSGRDFFAHKTGFTQKSLLNALKNAGFAFVFTSTGYLEINALAFLNKPDETTQALFNISFYQ